MSKETPLQHQLFTGELVDNRTSAQKRLDRQREQPRQMEMFAQREIAQFGVSAHPVMPLSPGRLVLIQEDPRTDEEKERDRWREAEALTHSLFEPEEQQTLPPTTTVTNVQKRILIPICIEDPPKTAIKTEGYRKRQRRTAIRVRSHRRAA